MNARDKLLKKFKKSRLHIHKELYEKLNMMSQSLLHQKSQHSLKRSFQRRLANLKSEVRSLKTPGMRNKVEISNFNRTEDSNTLTHDS